MTLDLLDRAFIQRLRSDAAGDEAAHGAQHPETRVARSDAGGGLVPTVDGRTGPPIDEPIGTVPAFPPAATLERLLERASGEWNRVADEVEAAAAPNDGRAGFVLAVVARRRGDGCSTFVEGLARSLRGRGIDVVTTTVDRIDRDAAGIQLVDAGNWFGTGPIRRERSAALADTCDAAILLRRADRSTAAAFGRALEVAGVRVLGEVTTFGRTAADPIEAAA